tara:strand:- start:2915 stop:5374 length:2460 start_codon:yes stop_codon:yes gene_type:complete
MKENFSKRLQKIIKCSKEEAIRLGHSYVGSEHLLLALLKEKEGLTRKIIDIFDLDPAEIVSMLEDMIKSSGGTMTLGHLPLTRRAERVLRNSFSEATSNGNLVADDEYLLLSILKEKEGVAYEVLKTFSLDYDTVNDLIHVKNENISNDNKDDIISANKKTPTLDHFSRDVTGMALNGDLDPVIGRNIEIERVAQILTRRKKNNPVLIGEPGVGKTAILEGLAQRIISKKVPRVLFNKRILSLDLASLVAGTKYRGQFEERLKSLMVELESNRNIIVFIDEIHMLVGAGGATGTLDAANMFKPSLARGDLHCIGATTIDEYTKHVEKDGALDRRLQKIIINPPSFSESVDILIGLKSKYEDYHRVKYTKNAIKACVYLSDRYISDRFLPDKAIDILDEAGARAHIFNSKIPKNILKIEKNIKEARLEKDLKVSEQLFEQAALLRDKEKKLVRNLSSEKKKWEEMDKMNPIKINQEQIADVVAMITGIPLSKVAQTESKKLLLLDDELNKFIIGQEKAISSLAKAIRRARVGLKSPTKPIGAFLFLGPTGVGKTQSAKVLAKYLIPSNRGLIKIDMSEFSERFTISRLIGAPPGYIGYEEGGELTEKVRRNPFSVILFDEIEKGHPDIFNILLQIMDEGTLTDGFGRKIDFKNTIIIMTSNMGIEVQKKEEFGFSIEDDTTEVNKYNSLYLNQVEKLFPNELINRIDESIIFKMLNSKDILEIIELELTDLRENIKKLGLKLKLAKSAKVLIAKNGFNPKHGARPLNREIQRKLTDPISELLLQEIFSVGSIVDIRTLKGEIKISLIHKTSKKKKTSEIT